MVQLVLRNLIGIFLLNLARERNLRAASNRPRAGTRVRSLQARTGSSDQVVRRLQVFEIQRKVEIVNIIER